MRIPFPENMRLIFIPVNGTSVIDDSPYRSIWCRLKYVVYLICYTKHDRKNKYSQTKKNKVFNYSIHFIISFFNINAHKWPMNFRKLLHLPFHLNTRDVAKVLELVKVIDLSRR